MNMLSYRQLALFIFWRNSTNNEIMEGAQAMFKIVGMYCATWKPIVEKQLKDEKAVKKIDVDYMTDTVIVEFDPSLITKEEIKTRAGKVYDCQHCMHNYFVQESRPLYASNSGHI